VLRAASWFYPLAALAVILLADGYATICRATV
jgi:hypothetical protein